MLVAHLDRFGARRLSDSGDGESRFRVGVRGRGGLLQRVGAADAAAAAMAERLEPRLLLALVEWDGGAGTDSWHDAMNWSGDAVPTAVDDVVIGEESGAVSVDGQVEAGSLLIGSQLSVHGSLLVSGPVEVHGLLQLGRGGTGLLGFIGAGSTTLGGTGRVALGVAGTSLMGRVSAGGGGALTVAADLTISGFGEVWSGGEMTVVGTIRADEPDRSLVISAAGALVHSGRFESPGGSLYATSPSVRIEGGTFDSRGGIIGIGGWNAVIENTGRTIRLDAETGDLHFAGMIRGGELATSDGARFVLQGTGNGGTWATLDGVRVSGDLHVRGAELQVRGGLVLDGSITLGDGGPLFGGTHLGWGKLSFSASSLPQTMSGSGEIVFDHHPGPRIIDASTWIAVNTGASVTITSGITVRGGGGVIRVAAGGSLVLDGAVVADSSNRAIGLYSVSASSEFVASGRLESSAGLLEIGGYLNTAIVIALRGQATIVNNGGGVRLLGRIDLVGQVVTMRGEVLIGATVIGGTISASDVASYLRLDPMIGGMATFRSVSLGIPVHVDRGCSLFIEDGLVLNSTIQIGSDTPQSAGTLYFRQTPEQLVTGNGAIAFAGPSSAASLSAGGSHVTLDAGIVVRGGHGRLATWSGNTLRILGTLDAHVPGTTIRLEGDITHHGVMRIAAGATIARTGVWTFQPDSRLEVEIGGTVNAQIGRFTATGAVTMGGVVEVRYVSGYEPPRGSSIRFVSSVGASGAFASVVTPQLSDPDLKSPVLIDGQGVRLIVTHIADHNNDLTVNDLDIFAFLNDWFAGRGDFDGDGTRTVSDIFVFLSAWYRA